ncbi:hypothetical protein C8R47DRAFT_1083816 [Mycena vitilis]|nr:hypothetical protein C8R47DRAFT_1083816 [Mycena vitilis]
MAPPRWATDEQRAFLFSWMPDFIRRQAEGKLHLFWAPMQQGWFTRFSAQADLGLPLPNDPNARALTPDELATVGAAIMATKKRLESWFRYERKKIAGADPGVAASAGATAAMIRNLFNFTGPKRTRVHHPIEIFQLRNVQLINKALTAEGYDELRKTSSEADEPDDWTDESSGTEAADAKTKKSLLMRLRTRVITALWKAASPEEKEAVAAELEQEKETMRKKDLQDEEENKARTPEQLQDGIDVLDTVFSEVQKAAFKAGNWVSMTIIGGPNPRLGGELSLKIISCGQTPAGNDFEDACINFDKNVVESFEGFMRLVYTAEQRKACALPTASTAEDAPRAPRVVPVPAPHAAAPAKTKTKHPKKAKNPPKKKKSASAARPAAPAAPSTPAPAQDESIDVDVRELDASSPAADNGTSGATDDIELSPRTFSLPEEDVFGSSQGADDLFSDNSEGQHWRWPPGMSAPLSPTAAAALALKERGGVPGGEGPTFFGGEGPTFFAIDPQLDNMQPSPTLSPQPVPTPVTQPVPTPVTQPLSTPAQVQPSQALVTQPVPTPVHMQFSPTPVQRPKPRPTYGLSAAAKTAVATNAVGGFNFPSTNTSALSTASPYRPSVLFDALRRSTSSRGASGGFSNPTTAAGLSKSITTSAFGVTKLPTNMSGGSSAFSVTDPTSPAPSVTKPSASAFGWRSLTLTPATSKHPTAAARALSALLAPTLAPADAPGFALAAAAVVERVAPQSRPQGNPVPQAKAAKGAAKGAKAKAPAKKKVAMAKADEREAAAGTAEKTAAVAEVVKRPRGRPRKSPMADTTNAPAADAQATAEPVYVTSITNNNRARALQAAREDKAREEKEAAEAVARQAAKGWIETTQGGGPTTVVFTRSRRQPKPITFADGTVTVPKVNKNKATEDALIARMEGAKKTAAKKPAAKKTEAKKTSTTTTKRKVAVEAAVASKKRKT